jgi:hypothetical protein
MRFRPGDLLAWVLAVTASALIVVFATFLMWDWYYKDFSRLWGAAVFDRDVRTVSPIVDAVFAVFIAAIPATFITRYFRSSRGDLEFSALGVKFKGPAGPILLWVVSFLAVAAFILSLLLS